MNQAFHPIVDGPLLGFVEQVFAFNNYRPEHRHERVVPDGRVHLVIECDGAERYVADNETLEPLQPCSGAWVSGVHRNFFTIGPLPEVSALCVVRFAVGGARPFLHAPLESINDRIVPAEEFCSLKATELRESLVRESDIERRVEILIDQMAAVFDRQHLPHDESLRAAQALCAEPDSATLSRVYEELNVSAKHLIDLFRRDVGPTPKVLHRLLRFSQIVPRIHARETVDWAAVSVDCGYYDQSHLIRDFAQFSGFKPAEFLEEGHDRLNFFPIRDSSESAPSAGPTQGEPPPTDEDVSR